ncbi:glycolate oxidase FAD binding subunit [Loktanella fryxellensis]|uniref:Glycolate oxidase FAD binding subunit n=1 Tax=Loktanella fryxellensis TaxID=245187 RepID=A0A1H8CSI2_9RHOB|nr:FAD-binding protein [Loktanella fryxellensis]SEM97839.1 glycolate oxidase FAD binding subunit [Loktanella fryxellensis]
MTPASEDELAEVIGGAQGPFAVRGGGTRGVSCDGIALSTVGLSGITLYEPGALTLVVRAGTPLAEVERLLAAEGQRLAFEPCDMRRLLGTCGASTIGGVVATNASGPRRIQVGACRDHLLGVRFVDGMGQVVKNGGRVMKNVTGYDLVKLMAGAHGTLGVLTEVSLKVLPRPEAVATLVLDEPDAARAATAMAAALGSPFDVTGAAWVAGRVLIRLEGFAASVDDRAARLGAALGADRAEVDWDAVRDAHVFADRPGDVWRVSVRPSALAATVGALQAGGAVEVAADWGGGLIWVLCAADRDLRRDLAQGHATRVRGAALPDVPRFQPEAAQIAAISAGLRQRFDPRGILNQGVMG